MMMNRNENIKKLNRYVRNTHVSNIPENVRNSIFILTFCINHKLEQLTVLNIGTSGLETYYWSKPGKSGNYGLSTLARR